jgi:DNA-directed RNA polymerase subunit K/omega
MTSPPESRLNKYEMVIVAAKEARRLNDLARQQGREVKGRITQVAMDRFLGGDVKYKYEES